MRWRRVAVPLGIAVLLLVVTAVAYAIEEPDPTESTFLSPVSAAPDGGQRLAEALRARGVRVQRETRTSDALVAAHEGDATLFVPVPAVVHPDYLRMLSLMPASTRVVFVDPPDRTLDDAAVPLRTAARRWATEAVRPDADGQPCTVDEAGRAGVAAALRQRYAGQGDRCYGGGVVRLRWSGTELVVIGASDPFRNERIGEHANEALAAGLLGTRPRVVWLDLHRLEPPPGVVDEPPGEPGAPPSLAADPSSGAGAPGDGAPGDRTEGDSGTGTGTGDGAEGEAEGEDQSRADEPNPLWDAFPAWFWALLAQLALAVLVFALWRARRLGPPVGEPLPVTVRAAETVLGRGRLYRRAKARGPVADVLRAAARDRIRSILGPDVSLVDEVVAHTGRDRDEVDALLYGPTPENDEELQRLQGDLEALLHAIGRAR